MVIHMKKFNNDDGDSHKEIQVWVQALGTQLHITVYKLNRPMIILIDPKVPISS